MMMKKSLDLTTLLLDFENELHVCICPAPQPPIFMWSKAGLNSVFLHLDWLPYQG